MKKFLLYLFSLFFALSLNAQSTTYFNTNGIAIKGYDPVAYFTLNKAIVGNDSLTMQWSGTTWKFTTAENLQLFSKAPQNYAPEYGGFCAYGTSEKHLSPTNPHAFTIVNNKLYLNYSLKVKDLWIKDTINRIIAADNYWSTLNK